MLQNREKRKRMVGGLITVLVGVLILLNNFTEENVALWTSIGLLAVGAIIFIWAYLPERETYALVGAYVMGIIAIFMFIVTQFTLEGNIIPTLVLSIIAFPFLAVWFFNQKKWGFLIPAYVLLAIIPVLYIPENAGNAVASYVMGAVGLPFLVTYFVTQKRGFLIPAAILLLFSLGFMIIQFGATPKVLTLGLPSIVIVTGIVLLFRAWVENPLEHLDK